MWWQTWIIESAGEPLSGTVSSELFGTLTGLVTAPISVIRGFKTFDSRRARTYG